MNGFPLILAAFVNPGLLAGGVVAMGAPILIHLLARRRFQRVRWAAMDFLFDAELQNRRRVRLEELILLLLRCLAVALIGAVVARPFFKPSAAAALLGGRDRTERIFLLDDSFSMGYLTEGEPVFARAKTSVANLLTRLREHAPNDTVTLLRSSRLDQPVVAGALLDDRQFERILAQIEGLQVSQASLNVEASWQRVARALDEESDAIDAAVYVVSDFQRGDWTERSGEAPAAALAAWVNEQRAARVVLIDVGDDSAANVAVASLNAVPRQIVAGVEAPIEAVVANHAADDAGEIELDVVTGEALRATAPLERVPAGGRAPVRVPAVFPRAGDAAVRVELPPDNLPVDDRRFLAVEVSDAVRVLLVSGEASPDSYTDETFLLAAALQPQGDVLSGNRVDTIDEADLDGTALDAYHVVVLCNLYRVSEPAADALHRFVARGGGLGVFLGDQVSDPATYNAALYRDGEGLLPGELLTMRHLPGGGATLTGQAFQHPVMRVFAGEDNPFLNRVRFDQYYTIEPGQAFGVQVLARFGDDTGDPAIIEGRFGQGRVMLFASSCDLEWNDWARDPSYVVAMLEAAQYLARAADVHRDLLVGQPLTLDVDAADYEPHATVRGPAYPQESAEEIVATATDSGALRLAWLHTDRAGIYQVVLARRDGGEVVRQFAVNVDTRESDLSAAGEDELRAALGGLPVDYIAGVPEVADEADAGRTELWPAFLVAALAVLLLEQFLAWRFGRA